VAPSPGGALGTAGLSRGGERRTGLLLTREGHQGAHPKEPGFLLSQESHCGPLTRRCLGHRRPLPRWGEAYWTAACGAVTRGAVQRSLGSCLRRNDTCWISACAGMTLWPPHPAVPWAPPASPAVGRGVETTSEGPFVQGPAGGSGRNSIDVRALYRSARALCTRSGRWKRSKSASASGRSWPVCGSTSRKHSNSMALVLSWPS